jgi:hypothetical protein
MAKKLSYDDIPPGTIIICPKCKAKNLKADQYCENCKEDLRSAKLDILNKLGKTPSDDRQKAIMCPFCGASNPRGTISCYNCANSFKKSIWAHKRTIEDLRERYLEAVIVSLVLSGVSFALGIWQNNYTEMAFGIGIVALAAFLALHRHWLYTSSTPQPVIVRSERPAVHIRRKSMIVVKVGIALVLFGLGSVVGAFLIDNSTHSATMAIPGGHYAYFRTNSQVVLGHLSGSYLVSPGGVSFRIYTSDEFQSYSSTGLADSIYQSNGSSGAFSVDLPGAGTYYLVAVHSHDSALQSTTQDFSLTYSLSGIDYGYLVSGVGIIVVGVALIATGRRIRNKVRRSAPAATNGPASGLATNRQV